jgi:RNA polymerase sigma-70 factor, ECF subfamily
MGQMAEESDDITRLLAELGDGRREALDEVLPHVYGELRRIAARHLRAERSGHTLQPTALVNEAYMRLVDQTRVDWQGRTHFYAVAAGAMRRILIDHARGRRRFKRGGDAQRVTFSEDLPVPAVFDADVIDVHEALERLAAVDERQARIVELRFFAGLGVDEVAEVLGVSKRTVEADWTHAKAWMRRALAQR